MFAVLTRRTGSDRVRVSRDMSRLTVSKGKQPWRSAARLAQKPCTEARQLNLRLETSHGELIIRTLAQWILRPKRTMVAKLSALKFGPSNHRTSTHQVVGENRW